MLGSGDPAGIKTKGALLSRGLPICTLIMEIIDVQSCIKSGHTMGKAKRQGGIMLNGQSFRSAR